MNSSQSNPIGGKPPDGETADLRSHERCLLVGELSDELAHQLTVVSLQVMGHADAELVDELRTALQNVGRAAETGLGRLRLLVRILTEGPAGDCPPDVASLAAPTPPSLAAVRACNRLHQWGPTPDCSIPAWVDDLDPISQRTLSRALDEAVVTTGGEKAAEGSSSLSVYDEQDRIILTCRLPAGDLREPPPDLRALAERVDLIGGHLSSTRTVESWELTLTLPCTLPDRKTGRVPDQVL